jgi:peptide deformylase
MRVVHYPHPALRWKSKPVVEINAELRATVARMFELMYENKGIGLAANQVALPIRVFVANITGDANVKDEEHVFINPEILHRKGTDEAEEGCLSLPELYGPVKRAEEIVVDAFDLDGQQFEMTLNELPARVVQHEMDHLDGVLFTDRMSDAARRELEPRIADFEALFRRQQSSGEIPSDDEIRRQLRELEPSA